ncbi:DarT ssDNA thymidine ADP-ribosyltransferase family protein [Microbacterium sp. STN6]|uniref:DarT ssDNA thymidine ADP-ribosyltransferase family protein n=1 Tax=Microbacterium sp. STN6 TaxID=2995588 RepID=UPI002260DF5E|nr:DarT ssDNA thymidine ADP-ribosyltransferase family protein [Microbacterium sp. STN6]MCX7521767.1 DarT ssDNA thymidine ADP-ribosyltransferase family protein [Microbacterium sp. STN6]
MNVDEQRVYHLTHIANLRGILAEGRILADANGEFQTRPEIDIAAPDTRQLRRETLVGERSVADFVPFFLSPDAELWQTMREGRDDPRLSAQGRRADPHDFVMFVSTIGALARHSASAVLASGDATAALTRFDSEREGTERMLRRLSVDDDPSSLQAAELLVPEAVSLDVIALVGVAGERARREVREMLATSPWKPKVAVYPPWFRAEADGA